MGMAHRNKRRRRGLSIAEVMISLAISSMLLVGVTAAYSASASAAEGNDKFFRATQAARVTMTQLLAEIRRADRVITSAGGDVIYVTREASMRQKQASPAAVEDTREYAYDAVNKKITVKVHFKRTSDGVIVTSPTYTMCRNVSEAKFGPADKVSGIEVRVPVTLVVKTATNEVRLSDTAGVRRAL